MENNAENDLVDKERLEDILSQLEKIKSDNFKMTPEKYKKLFKELKYFENKIKKLNKFNPDRLNDIVNI